MLGSLYIFQNWSQDQGHGLTTSLLVLLITKKLKHMNQF